MKKMMFLFSIMIGLIISCKGPQGEVGPQGKQGIQGVQGVQGESGIKIYFTDWKQYSNWTNQAYDVAYKNIDLAIEINDVSDFIIVQVINGTGDYQTLPCNAGWLYTKYWYYFKILTSKSIRILATNEIVPAPTSSIPSFITSGSKFRIIILRMSGTPNLRKSFSSIDIDEVLRKNGLSK